MPLHKSQWCSTVAITGTKFLTLNSICLIISLCLFPLFSCSLLTLLMNMNEWTTFSPFNMIHNCDTGRTAAVILLYCHNDMLNNWQCKFTTDAQTDPRLGSPMNWILNISINEQAVHFRMNVLKSDLKTVEKPCFRQLDFTAETVYLYTPWTSSEHSSSHIYLCYTAHLLNRN